MARRANWRMNPVRILVDSFADEDSLNAQMTNARDLMSRFDPERFQVTTFVVGTPDERLIRRPSTRLIQLPRRRQTVGIVKEFVWGRHDILFYVKPSPAAQFYMAWRKKWFDRRPVIGTVESQSDLRNEPTINSEQVRLWERTVLRSDFLFSNSSAVQASLRKEYGRESEVIPTGVDTEFFTPAADVPRGERVRVLFVGALRPFKGAHLLIRGASLYPAVDFVIVGEGFMAAELEAEAKEKRLHNVTFLRGLKPSALRDEYRRADIFLFPSRWEGSPKVILEAAACGLPVIARRDYEPETVVNGETGFLGASDDELLDSLKGLIANQVLRRRMGSAGRARSKRFDWDIITRQWEAFFWRLAQSRNPTGRAGVQPPA
jgi:glycosyltransferase involved in cell wall biosynthesis